jgi:hypothetical protein
MKGVLHPLLSEIDNRLKPLAKYWIRTPDEFFNLDEADQEIFLSKRTEMGALVAGESEAIISVLSQLSPEEIAEAYRLSSRILRGYIGGQMYGNFDEAYIPTMMDAIKQDHDGAYLFLGALGKNLSRQEFIPIILSALDAASSRTVDTALAFAKNLHVVEASPKVLELTKSENSYLAKFARETLRSLEA